jgi:Gpi18-like mannosyltransferase
MMTGLSRPSLLLRILLCTGGIVAAVIIRLTMLNYVSGDYSTFLEPWYRTLQSQGFAAFRSAFSNYSPFYLYILFALTKLAPDLLPLYAIKLPSILADFFCAWLIQQIAAMKYGTVSAIPWVGFFAVLFLPTVILNGSAWGQADSIYTATLLACLLLLLRKRPGLAMLVFGLTFAMKLQSIFFLPFLLAVWIRERYKWKSWLWIPFVYLLLIIPAWLAGRPWGELLTIYFSQVDFYSMLTLNAPTLYAWWPVEPFVYLYPAGLLLCGGVCLVYVIAARHSKIPLAAPLLMHLAMVTVLLVPFFMPKMHERYFFSADILSIAYALYFPEFFIVPLLVCAASWISYLPFLFHIYLIPLPLAALPMFCALLICVIRLLRALYPENKNKPSSPSA